MLVSTGPQEALSPLTTRLDQRSRTMAVADEREDGAWEALTSQSSEVFCHHSAPQSGPHLPLLPM